MSIRHGLKTFAAAVVAAVAIGTACADVPNVKIDDVALTVDVGPLGGVQLWENGPYWAECNVGASKPEEYGYYFWWGDTVGYRRNADNNGWVSVANGASFSFGSGNCPTYGKNNSQLQSAVWIDASGNLVAAHDAATAHLGAPWRMPTGAEGSALISNCTTTWMTSNGVSGRLVTGKGAYASKSIFLPAAGNGYGSYLNNTGSYGLYWSSTPYSDSSYLAWELDFGSGGFGRYYYYDRYYGQSVRPLRGFAEDPSASYTVAFNANGGAGTMADEAFTYGASKALTANAFTRTGYTFGGWATCATGSVVYTDGQTVSNLTAIAGGTVMLYAVWVNGGLGGVQLWENGPYWAECNVGATKPEKYGYYFWWGDTVGYKRNAGNNGWVSVADGASFSFGSGNCPTYGKNNSQLQSEGWIDALGNLVAAHDAATAHLGAPWRMPTDAEWSALISNCTTAWMTSNGVSGRLVTGKGAYASKSIFLPAAGYGSGSYLYYAGSNGYYWSSTPYSDYSYYAWKLYFSSGYFYRYSIGRYSGRSVRPLRAFAE